MSASCPRLGFYLRLVLRPETEARAVVGLRQSFAEAAAAQGLTFRIGGTLRHWMNLVWREGSQAVDADREALRAWAQGVAEVESLDVGPLTDLDEG